LKNYLFILGIISLSFFSCSKKKVPEDLSNLGLDYYPTKLGKYVVYDVDSIVYTQLPKDTLVFKYRIKEKLTDTFSDNLGQPAIRLERYIKTYNPAKSYDSIPWTVKEVWMVNANFKTIQVVESNVRFTKLIFPIQENASWDGNANNSAETWDYSYTYIDRSEKINGLLLENVAHVKQKDYRTLISYQYYTEKYAKEIGLVYREIKDLLSNNIIANKPVEERIESGIIYKQTLVTYGYE
jgi:hypothetical protein